MARSINKVILLGNLTRDPILRQTKSGKAVCDFCVATNRSWTTETGEKREEAEFHNIVAWGRPAETAGKYLKKGNRVYVEGRIQSRDYEAKDGTKKSRTEIVVEGLVMLDGKGTNHTDEPTDAVEAEAGFSDSEVVSADTSA